MRKLATNAGSRRVAALAAFSLLLAACSGNFESTVSTGGFFFGLFYFFLLIIWFTFLIRIFADIFHREDMSGWAKGGWTVLIIVLPLLGILIYVIARPHDLPQDRREAEQYAAAASRMQGGKSVDDIAKAAELKDKGVISEEEFQDLKHKALS